MSSSQFRQARAGGDPDRRYRRSRMLRVKAFRFAAASAFALFAACGGEDGVTAPPPPVATTIDVVPSSRSMLVGDTLTLVATVRDQNGAAMQALTVTWSSQNAAVASVSAAGTVTALTAGTAVITASASGESGAATLTVAVPVPSATLEPSARVTAIIGPDGGTLEATSASGTQYELEIPAGALPASQEIRMTPVTDISHLGLSGGLAGAVELQPSGLVFAQPARLRIRSSRSAAAGMRLTGFSASSDFSSRELSLSTTVSSEVFVLVAHFSIAGAGFGTTAEVSQFAGAPNQTLESIINQVAAITPTPWDAQGIAQATQLAQQAFDQIVRPALTAAANDAALLDAVNAYMRWRYLAAMIELGGQLPIVNVGTGVEVLGFPLAFLDEAEAGIDAAADGIRLAIDANAHVCGTQASMAALRNVFFWYGWAFRLHADVAPNGLDPATVISNVEATCATVVLKNSNMPDSLPAGQNFNLDLNYSIRFRNGTEQPADFSVNLVGSGVTVTDPTGFTGIGNAISPVGYYTTAIKPTTSGGFRLRSVTCFVPVRSTPDATELCGRFELTKVIYFNAFTSGPAGNEWSTVGGTPGVTTSPSGQRHLGLLDSKAVRLTLDSLPQHATLQLEFDLYIVDSWNGNGGSSGSSADVLAFEVLNGGVLKSTTFSNKPRDVQAFPGDYPGSSFPAATGATSINGLGYPGGSDFHGDASYGLRLTFDHAASSIVIIFGSSQSSSQNERWGLDNVRLKIVQ